MKLPPVFQKHRADVDAWLQAYLSAETDATEYGVLIAELERLIARGGKRIRPGLTLLAYEGYGGRDETSAVQLAGALELLHNYFLIHDDIIDRDLSRHGGPNIAGVYVDRLSARLPAAEADHYAAAMALLAGDCCRQLAYRALSQLDVTGKVKTNLLTIFLRAEQATLRGETNDVGFGLHGRRPQVREVLEMYGQKTAVYSFSLPLQAGALLAGADVAEQDLLANLGMHLGLAYQLQDDVLDMFGDERETGRPPGSDLREHKLTVPILLALQQADIEDGRRLQSILHAQADNPATYQEACQIITRSGALRITRRYISRYGRQARGIVVATKLVPGAQAELTACINQLSERQA